MGDNNTLLTQFEPLDFPERRAFYRSLTDDDRDAFYQYLTDALIGRVHLTEKNRIDAKTNRERGELRGYIVPDECHRAENDCLWRSGAWYVIMGRDAKVFDSLPHMHSHFEALRHVK